MMNSIDVKTQLVGCNEYLTKFIISSMKKRLLNNDLLIDRFYRNFILAGPACYIKGYSYPLGAKIWANGQDEHGDTTFGIYISLVDNNLLDPATADGAKVWKRFETESMNEYNRLTYDTVISSLNDHIAKYHDLNSENSKYLLKNLGNLSADYKFRTKGLVLSSYTQYENKNDTGGGYILEYNLMFAPDDLANADKTLAESGYSNPYVCTNVNVMLDLDYVYNTTLTYDMFVDTWNKFHVLFSKSFSSNDYQVIILTNAGRSFIPDYNAAYTYNETPSGFDMLVESDPTNLSVYVYCLGECQRST